MAISWAGNRKFAPIDLRDAVNAGPTLGRDNGEWRWAPGGPIVRTHGATDAPSLDGFPVGRQRLWGVPFSLIDPRANAGRCWIVLSGDPQSSLPRRVTIPLAAPREAGGLVFAHCTDIEGTESLIGDLLASYSLIRANGERLSWPIRRRLEINARRPAMGTQGYAAVSHLEPRPVRTPGASIPELTGMTAAGASQIFWLWGVENPEAAEPIVAIEVEAMLPDLVVIGGITLVRDRSNPLRRSPRTGIRIDLPPGPEGETSGDNREDDPYEPTPEVVRVADDVALSVDLGQIIRASAVGETTPEAWRDAPIKGWGAPLPGGKSNAVYAEVSASELAHLSVRHGEAAHTVAWRDVLTGEGRSPNGGIRVQVAHSQLARVRVQIVDADTGQPIASRVHFQGRSGEYLPPSGHSPDVNVNWCQDIGGDLRLGAMNYAYVPGQFEINLPIGTVFAEAVHGFEYVPLREVLTIVPGQTDVRLPMRRLADLRQRGYYSGDVHVHFLDPATASLEAAAEDLNVTELLAIQAGRLYAGVEHGIGRAASSSTPDHIIRIDSENRHHALGHIFLLGLTEPVFPLSSGGPSEDQLGGWDEVAMADWCDRCRTQGGIVVTQFTPTPHAEVVADIVLGKIDATEVRWFDFFPASQKGGHWGDTPFAFPGVAQWYRYLNCGYRMPAVGGTDKMTNAVAIGALRTYVQLDADEDFSYAAWNRAIKRGRTFVSCGPFIDLAVEGRLPGDEISLPGDGGGLEVIATAQSAQPFEFLEIVANGQVVARVAADPDGKRARLNATLTIGESSWIAARCYGKEKLWTGWPTDVGAHTSPVWITVDGKRQTSTRDANYLLTQIEGGLAYLDTLAAWRDQAQRSHHRQVFLDGREALLHDHPEARPHWHPHSGAHDHG